MQKTIYKLQQQNKMLVLYMFILTILTGFTAYQSWLINYNVGVIPTFTEEENKQISMFECFEPPVPSTVPTI